MFRKLFGIFAATILLTFQFVVGSASAVQLDKTTRTVTLNEGGETTVVSLKQLKEGKRLFNNTCSQCHPGGITKTNQNIGLDPETLALATPNRNNVEGLVDYLKNPTTFDGEEEISELHPSTKSADIFTEMRNLTDDDLEAIAGYILVQPKVDPIRWGGGKIYY
ncbi:MAG: cytochrome c-550 [Brasilonema octagenarum HA4186-MV1]|jgi:photosystem II cytochrome c550|uniref:Photosystem II extrinsic protein V n=2 Tax=Brasilonema TaxID=383614 RepID=A0A856MC31_9CYAN|nr:MULTISPECIES: photosystem II cytochrome c-550 [Brasilonema]MBW4591615.1 cytochrome c-550 [Brasilonema angustatum HA4187-MV1]MBW4626881.1 cytochrome c-550 [Brasilonema octagenarum HA4186-MV1]QDL14230.1 cytochrome c-550 [Brasilonema octagenarum UFV-E1]NMF63917.1 cytochrome c-550 [Brasilonema octagenarum UFV-OR1]QDL07870.1 cytochrome c-550 [Brasilonema sennae CENA114]